MHIQTHILSGWCLGNFIPSFGPRERFFCIVSASVLDIDGLGILVSEDWYWALHHALGHCLLFGVVVSLILTMLSKPKLLAFVVYLTLFHLHLMMDYFGSGPHWPLYYFWPFSNWEIENPNAWPFFSWQNLTVAFALLAWTFVIIYQRSRTPLEWVMPKLDAKLVAMFRRSKPKEEAIQADR